MLYDFTFFSTSRARPASTSAPLASPPNDSCRPPPTSRSHNAPNRFERSERPGGDHHRVRRGSGASDGKREHEPAGPFLQRVCDYHRTHGQCSERRDDHCWHLLLSWLRPYTIQGSSELAACTSMSQGETASPGYVSLDFKVLGEHQLAPTSGARPETGSRPVKSAVAEH